MKPRFVPEADSASGWRSSKPRPLYAVFAAPQAQFPARTCSSHRLRQTLGTEASSCPIAQCGHRRSLSDTRTNCQSVGGCYLQTRNPIQWLRAIGALPMLARVFSGCCEGLSEANFALASAPGSCLALADLQSALTPLSGITLTILERQIAALVKMLFGSASPCGLVRPRS